MMIVSNAGTTEYMTVSNAVMIGSTIDSVTATIVGIGGSIEN